MPHSIFMGRVWPQPGERLFLEDDTAAALALAEEERDACPSCGMPKAWCRSEDSEVGLGRFDVAEERCWATYRVALRRERHQKDKTHAATMQALMLAPRFRDGHAPALAAGLDLEIDGGGRG